MPADLHPPVIAVINNSEEVVEMLRGVLEEAGYLHVAETVINFRRRTRQLSDFLAAHDPSVLVWDIAFPYQANWDFFCHMRDSGALGRRGIVLTTTNKHALEQFVGPHGARELIGKPYDIAKILEAVHQAVRDAEQSPRARDTPSPYQGAAIPL